MSTSDGLSQSRIFRTPTETFESINGVGAGVGTLSPVLKSKDQVRVYNMRVNDANGAGGAFSVAIVRRGFIEDFSGADCPDRGILANCLIPRPAKRAAPDLAALCPDLDNPANAPAQGDIVVFEAPVLPNEFIAQDGSEPIFVLNPYDELWVSADVSLNWSFVYG